MAAPASLGDIETRFFECPVCKENLQTPKLLPKCLHRFCRECIERLIEFSPSRIKCPICKEQYRVPAGGVDGFQTDYHTRNVVDYLEEQREVQLALEAEARKCLCGAKDPEATYCPQIRAHLCTQCFQENKTALLGNQIQSLYLSAEGSSRNTAATDPEPLPATSRCHSHPEQIAQLRCTSCEGVPICTMCTYTQHQGHTFGELPTLSGPSPGPSPGSSPGPSPLPLERDVAVDIIEERVINISAIQSSIWEINSFDNGGDGRMVMTGKATETSAHVSVVQMDGEASRLNKIKKVTESSWLPLCHCASYSNDITIVASQDGQLGAYSVPDGVLDKINIRSIFGSWPACRFLTCVTCDQGTGNVLVGTKNRGGPSNEVLIFDVKLNYRRSVTLPSTVGYTRDLLVHGGKLIVCDVKGMSVISVSIHGLETRLECEFPSPDVDGGTWSPYRVCADSRGLVYILWEAEVAGALKKYLAQYNHDGGRLLMMRSIDPDAADVLTKMTADGEKLLIVTKSSGKIHVFGFQDRTPVRQIPARPLSENYPTVTRRQPTATPRCVVSDVII